VHVGEEEVEDEDEELVGRLAPTAAAEGCRGVLPQGQSSARVAAAFAVFLGGAALVLMLLRLFLAVGEDGIDAEDKVDPALQGLAAFGTGHNVALGPCAGFQQVVPCQLICEVAEEDGRGEEGDEGQRRDGRETLVVAGRQNQRTARLGQLSFDHPGDASGVCDAEDRRACRSQARREADVR
jgi:hypothetical protein